MNLERMKQWVKALRSGEYQQTTAALRDDFGFCCLGVVQDLYVKDGIGKWEPDSTWAEENSLQRFVCDIFSSCSSLVEPVATNLLGERFNKDTNLPFLTGRNNRAVSLAELNDKGLTFEQIADVIEWYFIRPEEEARRNVVLSQYNIM